MVSNIRAEKLTGPTILGKIELPTDEEARAKAKAAPADERRKRKRIPIEKKGSQQQQPQQGGAQLFKNAKAASRVSVVPARDSKADNSVARAVRNVLVDAPFNVRQKKLTKRNSE